VWFSTNREVGIPGFDGRLVDPEELEPGNIERTTASVSWLKQNDQDFRAITIGYGVNAAEHGTRQAVFAEGTRHVGLNSVFFRAESLQSKPTCCSPIRHLRQIMRPNVKTG
jgi:hypothetical protein